MFLFIVFAIVALSEMAHGYTYLTASQWKNIHSLMIHPELTPKMRNQLNSAIYQKYRGWAISKAYDFKRFHRHKCAHIPAEELSLYAIQGLVHAIRNYNGSAITAGSIPFTRYANYYLLGELYNGLTKLQPICNVPTYVRRQKKIWGDDDYKTKMNTLFVGKDVWKVEQAAFVTSVPMHYHLEKCIEMDEYMDFWKRRIGGFSVAEKRIFEYKYDFYLNRIRSNLEIAELMCCSEEWVRKTLVGSLDKILF
jgi:hypothetical protein